MQQFITRQRRGRHFHYYKDGEKITDQSEVERINKLAIPPAWKEVRVAESPRAKVQATGIDAAGRKQAIYSATFRARQEKAKFERIISFARHLPALREQVDKDLAQKKLSKDKVLACIVKLMDQAYFRVGNDTYARQHQTYGITTLRSRHANITTTSVTFDFIGKSGKHHVKKIKDKQIARIIRQLDELPGQEIFKYIDNTDVLHTISSSDVNSYIKVHMGDEFTAKDFRTWGGTMLATTALAAKKRADNERGRKKAINKCIKHVAKRLGNTPAVAKSSYIDPRIIDAYLKTDSIREIQSTITSMKPEKYLQPDERCVLALLEKA
jgi:DNA topoisomerase-1